MKRWSTSARRRVVVSLGGFATALLLVGTFVWSGAAQFWSAVVAGCAGVLVLIVALSPDDGDGKGKSEGWEG